MRFSYVFVAALLTACGSETGSESAPSAEADRTLVADFEELYRIGGFDAEGWDAFTRIADLDFDARGHLYIRDDALLSTRIVAVDGSGRLTAEFGRMGDGPGELRLVGHMVARPEGGVVLVDLGHQALLLFGADGSFERQIRLEDWRADRPAGVERVRHGRSDDVLFLTRSPGVDASGDEVSVSTTADRTIYRASLEEGEEVAAAPFVEGWQPRPERELTLNPEDPLDIFGSIGEDLVFFEAPLVFDVLPGGELAYVDSSAYEVKIEFEGAPRRIVGRPLHPQPVTEELRERAREQMLETMNSALGEDSGFGVAGAPDEVPDELAAVLDAVTAGIRTAVENASFMPEVPLVRELRTTWEGAIWVERWGSDPTAQIGAEFGGSFVGPVGGGPEGERIEDGWIDVFAPEGEYVGTFSLEETPMPGAFGPGGLVAFVETDELDVPTVIVKRLTTAVR